jgi:chromosome segregation ATPase
MEDNNQKLNLCNDLSNNLSVSDNSSTFSDIHGINTKENNTKIIKRNKLKDRIEELERINNDLSIENIELSKKLDEKNIHFKVFEYKINNLNDTISKLQIEYCRAESRAVESNLQRFNKESEIVGLDKKITGLNYHIEYLINILQEKDKEIFYLNTELNKLNNIINEQTRLLNNNLYQIPLARHPPLERISQYRERSKSEFIPIEKKMLNPSLTPKSIDVKTKKSYSTPLHNSKSNIKSQLSETSNSDIKPQIYSSNSDIRLNSPFENSVDDFERPTLSSSAKPFVPQQYNRFI